MAKLKPIKSAEELSAIPIDEPVLVELEPAKTGTEREEDDALQTQEAGTPENGFNALKQQLAAAQAATKAAEEQAERERTRAREAEKERLRAAQEAEEARNRVTSTETSMIETSLEAAQRERENARKAVKQAFETGDSEALADAQERLARASSDIREYERAAAELDARKTRQPERKEPQANLSPEDAIDANPNLMAAERTWLKAHMDAVLDQARNNDLGLAYRMATREGHRRGSPEYFDYLETFMGYKKAPTKAEPHDEEDDAIVSAPVSRENRSSSGQYAPSPNRIKLTPEQREFARTMGLTDVQYAQQVAALERDKKSNPEKYFGRG